MTHRRPIIIPILILILTHLLSIHSFPFPKKPHKITGPIKTIVVLVMENRSFDHMLGWIKKTRPDIDGLTGHEFNLANASDPDSDKMFVTDDAVFVDSDPGHSIQAIREQIFGSGFVTRPETRPETRPILPDPDSVNGFVQQENTMGVDGLTRERIFGSGYTRPETRPTRPDPDSMNGFVQQENSMGVDGLTREQIFGSGYTRPETRPILPEPDSMNGFVQQENSMGVDGLNREELFGSGYTRPETRPGLDSVNGFVQQENSMGVDGLTRKELFGSGYTRPETRPGLDSMNGFVLQENSMGGDGLNREELSGSGGSGRSRPDPDSMNGFVQEANSMGVDGLTREELFGSGGSGRSRPDPDSVNGFVHEANSIGGDGNGLNRKELFGSGGSRPDPVPEPALMNGFVQQANSMGVDGLNRTVMAGFKPELVPSYNALVDEFAVFDRWFASVPGSTQPNRLYVHSATSHGASSNVRKDLINGFPQKTIFDSLDENGLTFGIYYQNIPATLFFKSLRKLKFIGSFHEYDLKFKSHAKNGKLPNYVVVEQRYFDVNVFPANDDHPSHDVAIGQKFVKEVYETLRASPQWNEIALLITYDEHGGFYDHVATPLENVPNPDGINGPEPYFFQFDRLGVRVPTLLVSPWIDKGTVIHEPNGPTPYSQFEHSSISATVKKLFNLDSDFLTKRDEWAGTFDSYFNLRDAPRDDCPEKLPEIKVSLRPRGPKEDMKLTEFQVELIQLASQLNGDHTLNTYPYIGKYMTVVEAHQYAHDAVTRFLEAGRAAIRAGANESTIVTMRPALSSRAPRRRFKL